MHTSVVRSINLALRQFHIQLRPRMTCLTAQGVCNTSVKHRRHSEEAKIKNWYLKACHAINKADTG